MLTIRLIYFSKRGWIMVNAKRLAKQNSMAVGEDHAADRDALS